MQARVIKGSSYSSCISMIVCAGADLEFLKGIAGILTTPKTTPIFIVVSYTENPH